MRDKGRGVEMGITDRRPALERLLSREKDSNPAGRAGKDKIKIGVVGLSAAAGVSFLAFSLARHIANMKKQMPALLEIGDGNENLSGWNYDAIGIDKRFSGRDYVSFYKNAAECRSINKLANMDEGINFALRVPSEAGIAPDLQQMTSLINNVSGDVIVCDVSARLSFGEAEEERQLACLKRLLQEMTLVLFVVNPLPAKLLGGHKRLAMIKEMETAAQDVLYVVNMYGRGVNKKELYDYLKPRERVTIGLAPADELYEAEFNCKNPYQMAGVKAAASAAIEAILGRAGVTP
ncbi:MAG: hypothetical protein LBT26_10190 [Clostridiales Family XIII bacterium]|jgi:hypothetical protein|nr:hypothetical protein [Clostridiales Family XIII bacterium]